MLTRRSRWQRFKAFVREDFDVRQPRNRWRILFTAAAFVVVAAVLFSGGVAAWEYIGTPQFCGTFCHTDYPQYVVYQQSSHARVQCVACHVGTGFAHQLTSKVGDIGHVVRQFTGFEKPKHATTLRPARFACEECHWPDSFQGDSIRYVPRYESDQQNSLMGIYLIMKTGGGPVRQGRGTSIHWHVQQTVTYKSSDPLRQDIPWVQVVNADGTTTEYVEEGVDINALDVAKLEPRTMDCIDCHNRSAHNFLSPDRAMNQALSDGDIDAGIPFIKQQAVAALSKAYASPDAATQGITNDLRQYYTTQQATYYNQNTSKVDQAINRVVAIWQNYDFPDLAVNWQAYPQNAQHLEFPGCFRCHDGKHKNAQGQYIRLECNICHNVPAVQMPGEPVPSIPVRPQQAEPPSHLTTTWIAEHSTKMDQSCSTCHSDQFCSNQACHGIKYQFIGLQAGQGGGQLPGTAAPGGAVAGPRPIPHATAGMEQCLTCHQTGVGGATKVPPDHSGRTNDMCQTCHKPG